MSKQRAAYTPAEESDSPAADRIPLLVLTGFLGSGKTSLVAKFVEHAEPESTVVIVNEFGEAGLDHLLVESIEDNVFLLENGCVCCRSQGELQEMLLSLLERRERGDLPRFSKVILETSGLTDPQPLLQILLSDVVRWTAYEFKGLVTVVDAALFRSTAARFSLSRRQIALADKIVISKGDLVSDADMAAVEAELANLTVAPTVRRSGTKNIDDLLWKLGVGSVAGPDVSERIVSAHSDELDSLFSVTRSVEPVPSYRIVERRLYAGTAPLLDRILRFKAVLPLAESSCSVVLHGVQGLWSHPRIITTAPELRERGRIVIIGEDAIRSQAVAILNSVFGSAHCGMDHPNGSHLPISEHH